jgi:hypothetical protein
MQVITPQSYVASRREGLIVLVDKRIERGYSSTASLIYDWICSGKSGDRMIGCDRGSLITTHPPYKPTTGICGVPRVFSGNRPRIQHHRGWMHRLVYSTLSLSYDQMNASIVPTISPRIRIRLTTNPSG